MKGKELTTEQIKALKEGDKVWLEKMPSLSSNYNKKSKMYTYDGFKFTCENNTGVYIYKDGTAINTGMIKVYEWKEDVNMREYTTLEVIKELKNNKELKFIGKGANGNTIKLFVENYLGIDTIMSKALNEDIEPIALTEFVLNMKWTKIQESVDFMTALNSGKRFKHKDMIGYEFSFRIMIWLKNKENSTEIREILNSKEWYVEE